MSFAAKKIGEIAVAIGRHRNMVSNILKDVENCGCIKRSGRILTIVSADNRKMVSPPQCLG
uniref:Uncharacterized protein n=1 Tax=Glossina palpalis gambiensis TaxID=67801 RepID=A0A1B0BU79_9MUSC